MTVIATELLNKHGYDVLQLIGHGGYAECYKVYSRKYSQYFVSKVMLLNSSVKKERHNTFQNECNALTSIIHPNIIHVYDIIVDESCVILILEYCSNGNLQDYIIRNGVYKDMTKLFLHLEMILSAFDYLEERKMAHNDIKPSNILIDQYGRLKLADFGLTQKFETIDDISEDYRGSLAYIAPEILHRKPYNPFKANVWSFGVMLYFLVVGRTPFPTDSVASFRERILEGSYVLPRSIDKTVAKIIKNCLILDPEKRISFRDIKNIIDETLPYSREKSSTLPQIPHLTVRSAPKNGSTFHHVVARKLRNSTKRRPQSILF